MEEYLRHYDDPFFLWDSDSDDSEANDWDGWAQYKQQERARMGGKSKLLPELWLRTISYLRVPLPPPNNGRSDRSVIRQSALCACMRVNKVSKYWFLNPRICEIMFIDYQFVGLQFIC